MLCVSNSSVCFSKIHSPAVNKTPSINLKLCISEFEVGQVTQADNLGHLGCIFDSSSESHLQTTLSECDLDF